MSRSRFSFGFLVLSLICAGVVRAETPADPLRLIPKEADLAIKIERPGQLVHTVLGLDAFKKLQQLDAVRELYDSTNYRRALQMLAYFEKELGVKWPELLDRLAGGGAVVAAKFGGDPAPVLLVVQGKDPALVGKFFNLLAKVGEQELARQDSKEKLEKRSYRNIETLHLGKNAHSAVAGSAMIFSTKEKALHVALDLHLDGDAKGLAHVPAVADAKKLLPANPLAWMWLNFDYVKKQPQAKEVLTLPRNDVNLTVIAGGWLDVVQRSSFLCAGLHQQDHGFLATIRMPHGRDGMQKAMALHIPPTEKAGALPVLKPKGVVASASYYFDLSQFWEKRRELFNDKQATEIENFDKNSGRFLLGQRFSDLVKKAGPHWRLLLAHQDKSHYKTVPGTRFPPFAMVADMRDPSVGKTMEGILRAAALLAGTQTSLKSVEEKEGDVKLVGYLFPEDKLLPGDTTNVRFNFSPCFARVGDQFMASSTLELGHEMIRALQQEEKAGRKESTAAVQSELFGLGGAALLQTIEDQLLMQTILNQAVAPDAAREQVKAYIDWVRQLGVLQGESSYGAKDFRYDFRLIFGKGS